MAVQMAGFKMDYLTFRSLPPSKIKKFYDAAKEVMKIKAEKFGAFGGLFG